MTVLQDDTWTFISRRSGTPIDCLYSLNNAGPSTVIHPGQQVKVL